jgi:hypothetical protein
MQPIIIIGMHRSGTSMVASIMKQLGVIMGHDLDENYESSFFYHLNEWIFHQAGATWDNPFNLNFCSDDFNQQIIKNLSKQICSIKTMGYLGSFLAYLKYKSLQNLINPWGWKDPRNTFTLNFWNQLFPGSRILHIYRNPVDVAISLRNREHEFINIRNSQTRTGIKQIFREFVLSNERLYSKSLRVLQLEEGIKLWEQYIEKAMSYENDESINIKHVCYETLIDQPREQITSILEFLNISINQNKLKTSLSGINNNRKYAFTLNPENVDFYESIKNNELVKKFGYDTIC